MMEPSYGGGKKRYGTERKQTEAAAASEINNERTTIIILQYEREKWSWISLGTHKERGLIVFFFGIIGRHEEVVVVVFFILIWAEVQATAIFVVRIESPWRSRWPQCIASCLFFLFPSNSTTTATTRVFFFSSETSNNESWWNRAEPIRTKKAGKQPNDESPTSTSTAAAKVNYSTERVVVGSMGNDLRWHWETTGRPP
jgi:hypothetical protein